MFPSLDHAASLRQTATTPIAPAALAAARSGPKAVAARTGCAIVFWKLAITKLFQIVNQQPYGHLRIRNIKNRNLAVHFPGNAAGKFERPGHSLRPGEAGIRVCRGDSDLLSRNFKLTI